MIYLNFKEQDLALCLLEPHWGERVKVALSLPNKIDRSMNGKESRRAFAKSMRYELSYTAITKDAEETATLRLWSDRIRDTLVAVPLWTDLCCLTHPVTIGTSELFFDDELPVRWGQWWVLSDGTNAEIINIDTVSNHKITLTAPCAKNWSGKIWVAPLLFGRPDKKPELKNYTDERAVVTLKFVEKSPWDMRISTAPAAIPLVGAGIPEFANLKLFSVWPNFTTVTTNTEEDVFTADIGFLREDQRFVYPGKPRMKLAYEVSEGRAGIAAVERLFADRLGVVKLFMAPTWTAAVRLDRNIVSGGDTLHIEPSNYANSDFVTHPRHSLLALLDDEAIRPVKVSRIAGRSLTLAAALTRDCKASATTVSQLILSRFSDTRLEWAYTSDGLAETNINLVEVPEEYATGPIDLPTPAFCYKFYIETPEIQYFRFTSHERPVYISGDGNYEPRPFEHDGAKLAARLSGDELPLRSVSFDGNPLDLFFPYPLELPVKLELSELNVDTGTADIIYIGEIKNVRFDGKKITATAISLSQILDLRVPNYYIRSSCGYRVFSWPCKAVAANFRVNCQLSSSPDGQTLELVGVPNVTNNYFAAGWLNTGTLAKQQIRSITSSTASVGGKMTITLRVPLRYFEPGQPITMYPGCDGLRETCEQKFNNYVNFGGVSFGSVNNPGLFGLAIKQGGGGKK